MSDVDEMISYNQGQTSYKVRVKSFKHKMVTWDNARMLQLKSFKVDGVTLMITLYPNGAEADAENHVSIYIENLNQFKISFVFDISLGERVVLKDQKFNVESNGSWGYPKFYKHSNNLKKDKDKDLEITCTFKWMFKELIEEIDDRSMIQSLTIVKGKTSRIEATLAGQGEVQERLEQRMESLEKSMNSLLRHEASDSQLMPPCPPFPNCPICLEKMTHETRIMQCGLGHFICQRCFDRLDYSSCPTCNKAITGRCHGMETYLKTLFDNNNK